MSTLITLDTQEAVKRLLNEIPNLRQMAEDGDIDAATLLLDIEDLLTSAKLTARQTQITTIVYVDGYSDKTAATQLGISARGVRWVARDGIARIINECQRRLAQGDATFAAHIANGKDVGQ